MKLRFNTIEDFEMYTGQTVLNMVQNVWEKIPSHYTCRLTSCDDAFYQYFNAQGREEVEDLLFNKTFEEAKAILKQFIMDFFNNKRGYVYNAFDSWCRPAFVTFGVTNKKIKDDKTAAVVRYEVEISITRWSHDGSVGTGQALRVSILNPQERENHKNEVIQADVPQSLKDKMLKRIEEEQWNLDLVTLDCLKQDYIDDLKQTIDCFLDDYAAEYEGAPTLKKQGIVKDLEDYLLENYKKEWVGVMDCIELKFLQRPCTELEVLLELVPCKEVGELYEEENTLVIYFLGEAIKHINKWSYTKYVVE